MFIQRLKNKMNEQGVTQADLVRRTGLSRSGVSQYLSGKSKPSNNALEKIAAALGVTAEWLTEGDTPRLTVQQAAELMGKSPQFVRVAMQQNILPIGTAVRIGNSSKYTYYISPKKFTDFTGIRI